MARVYNKEADSRSSSAIENISRRCSSDSRQACGYFFFDGRDSQNGLQRHEHLIRSLIWQISDQCETLPKALNDLYERCSSGFGRPALRSLHETLRLILDDFHHVYLIVDALDECTERGALLTWINKITEWKVGNLHLLVTSRPEPEIEKRLQSLEPVRVCLENQFVDRDIAVYIDSVLHDDQQPMAWKDDVDTCKIVKSSLSQKAQGMYSPLFIYVIYALLIRLSGSDGWLSNSTNYAAA